MRLALVRTFPLVLGGCGAEGTAPTNSSVALPTLNKATASTPLSGRRDRPPADGGSGVRYYEAGFDTVDGDVRMAVRRFGLAGGLMEESRGLLGSRNLPGSDDERGWCQPAGAIGP